MSKEYKIRYLPLFYEDLDKITYYISYKLNNKIAARNFLDKVETKIDERIGNLTQYEKYISFKKRKIPYYRIYVNNYTVFYTINEDIIEFRRILYSKRFFNDLI